MGQFSEKQSLLFKQLVPLLLEAPTIGYVKANAEHIGSVSLCISNESATVINPAHGIADYGAKLVVGVRALLDASAYCPPSYGAIVGVHKSKKFLGTRGGIFPLNAVHIA